MGFHAWPDADAFVRSGLSLRLAVMRATLRATPRPAPSLQAALQ